MRSLTVGFGLLLLSSCSTQYRIGKTVNSLFIKDPAMQAAHIGIAVQDPDQERYLYKFQSAKRFTPASNTKILSCYAAMKYLPEKLPAGIITELDTAVLLTPTGDPSFLHPEFAEQPLFDKLRSLSKPVYLNTSVWKSNALGSGWSWDDFSEAYMTERSCFPVYGNVIQWFQEKSKKENPSLPGDTVDLFIYSVPEVDGPVDFGKSGDRFDVSRNQHQNAFILKEGKESMASSKVPFITNGMETGLSVLKDTLNKTIWVADQSLVKAASGRAADTIYSRLTDSVLQKMMHRSDNFYADMLLMMVSQQKLKSMDEDAIISNIIKQDFNLMPQPINWVDGSGLSRYNQLTPESLIFILNKLKAEQPWDRIKKIFPSEGVGTLSFYKERADDFIIAKTGTLGGVICLSGYVKSKKGKWLTFSIMVNNHNTPTAVIRKKMESLLETL
ncbi:MAG: D-alanyl-D-alanine carboxypeptidase/D-alanyl-D-alanine-endopeptidase [Bacteroidota bacterium]|jgi:D-alanyl-D-alanine carboxypeptidase/D-alanyl-D-alanine-endopeptidase (penicillin-binding protein 4)